MTTQDQGNTNKTTLMQSSANIMPEKPEMTNDNNIHLILDIKLLLHLTTI